MKIKGVTALVTGANRGIGQQLVQALLDRGAARVYATARQLDDLRTTLAFDSLRVKALQLDVTVESQIEHASSVAKDVTLLINNAAVLEFGSALRLTPNSLRHHMEVNLHGLFGMTQAFSSIIGKNGGGAVVNILSLVALENAPGMAAYSASKAAALSLTKSFRTAFQSQKISVHAVFPGPVDTDMLSLLYIEKASPIEVARNILVGVESGDDNIFPDPVSTHWAQVARQL